MSATVHHTDITDTRPRILVVGSSYMGDTMLAVPFLRGLRRVFPGHAVDLLAEGRIPAELLHACPHLDAILPWQRPAKRPLPHEPREVRGRGTLPALWNALACGAALRKRRYARAYVLKRSPSAALVALRAGIPHRIGHSGKLLDPLLTRAVPVLPGRHQIDAWLDLLADDGSSGDDGRLEAWPTTDALATVDRLLEPLPAGRPRVFIAVTASDWRRQWSLGRWVEVIRSLVAERSCEIVLCGSAADRDAHAVLQDAAPGHVHDFSTAVPLRELTALVSRTDLFLGIESGLMHVAAACGVPTITIFDPRTVAAWRARGPAHVTISAAAASASHPTRRQQPPAEGAAWLAGEALEAVSVATVLESVRAALPTSATPRTVDLRTGRHRYAVDVRSVAPAVSEPAPASG
jgi:ADP-heptose:LPS heptosyltransferase